MSAWSETTVATAGSWLQVYRTGRRGAPAVLFAHGLTDNARYWTRTVDALEDRYDVVLYDARGHGQAGPAPDPFDEATRVDDLCRVVDALGLDRPALIGHSLGAATVAHAAANQPGLARSVVLEDPPWLPEPPTPDALRARLAQWKADLLALRALPDDAALAQRRAEEPDWDDTDHQLSLAAKRQVDVAVFDRYMRSDRSWRELVASIECPILLLTGDPDRGAFVTAAMAREAAGLWRAGRWVHCAGATHSIRYSRFEPYWAALRAFLDLG